MNAVILLNYNDSANVMQFIKHHVNYNNIDNIVVVDNCSTDNSWDVLSNYIKSLHNSKLHITRAVSNKGYAAGNNVGVKYAEEKIEKLSDIIISNPDVIVSENDFGKIIRCVSDGYQMATGLIYNYDEESDRKSLATNYGWMLPNAFDMFINTSLISYKLMKMLGKSNYLNPLLLNGQYIATDCVPGCFFVIKRVVFDEIGLFDERTFLFGEETILGAKLLSKGYKVGIVNDSQVLHKNSVSINANIRSSRKKAKIRLASELVYLKYYLKSNSIICKLYELTYWAGFVANALVYMALKKKQKLTHRK